MSFLFYQLYNYFILYVKTDNHNLPKESLTPETMEENVVLPIDANSSYSRHYTVQINAGEKEFCAFVDLEKGNVISIGYWVCLPYKFNRY